MQILPAIPAGFQSSRHIPCAVRVALAGFRFGRYGVGRNSRGLTLGVAPNTARSDTWTKTKPPILRSLRQKPVLTPYRCRVGCVEKSRWLRGLGVAREEFRAHN